MNSIFSNGSLHVTVTILSILSTNILYLETTHCILSTNILYLVTINYYSIKLYLVTINYLCYYIKYKYTL